MALTRRPRAGDVVQSNKGKPIRIGFATNDGIARDDNGRAIFIWGFGEDKSQLNTYFTIIEDGPDVPDERLQLHYHHDGRLKKATPGD